MEAESKEKIKRILEALLFVTSRPLSAKELRDVVSDVEVIPEKQLLPLLEELAQEYEELGRSFKLEETSEGFQIRTRSEYAPYLSKLYKDRRTEKLSHAVLETLAIIAYRQPITKSEVEGVRGVDVTGPLKKCLEHEYVAIVGKKEVLGRPFMYGTTNKFLKQFGLKTLDELPQIEELREMGESQKELALEPSEVNSEEEKPTDENQVPEEVNESPEAVEGEEVEALNDTELEDAIQDDENSELKEEADTEEEEIEIKEDEHAIEALGEDPEEEK